MKQRGKKKKRIKRNEDNLRELWDNVKRPNIQIIGVPEEDKKKGHEKILEEIIVENFLKMGKDIATQVQETQRVPNRINPRQNTPRHMLIKLKIGRGVKDIGKLLKEPEGTISSRLSRARKKLKTILEGGNHGRQIQQRL